MGYMLERENKNKKIKSPNPINVAAAKRANAAFFLPWVIAVIPRTMKSRNAKEAISVMFQIQ